MPEEAAALLGPGVPLDEVESKRLLRAYGIPVVEESVATSPAEAAAAVRGRSVLKILSPDIGHKSDLGLVRTGVEAADAAETYRSLLRDAARLCPNARLRGVVVQPMVEGAVAEAILGLSRQHPFGPVVMFGLGGVFAEVFADVAFGVPPFTRTWAEGMVARIKAAPLLAGAQGRVRGDVPAIVDAIMALQRLALDAGDGIAELDVNPLMVLPRGQGVVAVDALVVPADPSRTGASGSEVTHGSGRVGLWRLGAGAEHIYSVSGPSGPKPREDDIVTRPLADGGDMEYEVADTGGLSRPTSSQQVTSYIRRMIFTNELRAGDHVPQHEIAARLKVSRVPVREAIIALDREGWVTVEAHRGAFVNGLDAETVLDHYELIGQVYGFAARRATERGTVAQVARLTELTKELRTAEDPDELWRINGDFLRQLLDMARSRRIVAMARILAVSVVPGKYFAEVPGVQKTHKKGIRAVLRAIKEGDGPKAEAEYRAMLRVEAESVVTLLESRGIITG